MEIGLYANTHGFSWRDEASIYLSHASVEEMQPVRVAQLAEKAGFHSLWFPDHVSMPGASTSAHTANITGTRAYQARHNMMDAAVCMGAVAVSTTRIKLGTSCLIAPYRQPLSDARQFATIDQLSKGRLMLGVAAGWMAEEYASVGIDYAERNERIIECIEIYKHCWTDEVVSYNGKHYRFENLSMDPKPYQKPRPKIVFGGATPAGVKRAIQHCDGLYPLYLDPHGDPARYNNLQDVIREEAKKIGRDTRQFHMLAAAGARVTDGNDAFSNAKPRRLCTGTPEQVLSDLERFAKSGYSLVVCMLTETEKGKFKDLEDQIRRFGEQIIPEAKKLKPAGEWLPVT
ncbi:MAG: TIGR03619 family F420-dependent LLM class oxidoreductase [Alphaproteobacteria bacterium]|nr:TIGR03619 family F420-dependent LLM class oxidoreductase [Alphaproteobacteria bacterium]